MSDLAPAVDELVRSAADAADSKTLRGAVDRVLQAFEGAEPAARDAAVRALGRALGRVEDRSAQVLTLALGALVESGGSPELAWPAVGKDLDDILNLAHAYATAVTAAAKDEHIETAIAKSGAAVGKKNPAAARAWNALPARALTAVSCLVRSPKIRRKVAPDAGLLGLAWQLSDAVPGVGDLFQALRILDAETIVVLAPEAGLGWTVRVDGLGSTLELAVLLAARLASDPKGRALVPKAPDAKALAALAEPGGRKAPRLRLPFELAPWTALATDDEEPLPLDAMAADIPALDGVRVVLLRAPPRATTVEVEASFEGLVPDLTIVASLGPADVGRLTVKAARGGQPPPSKKAQKAGKAPEKARKKPAAKASPRR